MRATAAEAGGPPRVGMQERPSAVRAVATAWAILNAEGAHEKRIPLGGRLMREAKGSMLTSEEDLAARRERALEQATGLSAGVEDETFDDSTRRVVDDEAPRTFAQAEADLIASIRHATISGTLPEWTGRRLDGTEEPLSAYRGRVLLIDFWATWCVPCIDALPDLREMVADLPADRFALLAISVDEELGTVTEFMERGSDALVQLARGHFQRP